MFFDIVISLLDILSLALLLWIVKLYLESTPGTSALLPSWARQADPVYFIVVFFILFIIKNLSAFYITKAQFQLAARVATRISANNLEAYQLGDFNEYINVDSSVQVRKIGFQPFEFCQYMLSGMQQIITQLTLVGITIVAILLFNAKLFLLLLLVLMPPVVLVFYYIKSSLGKLRSRIRTSNERSFQYLLDALKGYVESNIYAKNLFFHRRFIESRSAFSRHLFDSFGIQALPSRVIEIFAITGLFILMAIAYWTGENDGSTLLTVGAFLAAAYKIIPGVVKIINLSGQMKAFEFSPGDLIPSVKNENGNRELPVVASIDFKNIDFSYAQLEVLKDFDAAISKGDFVGIRGRSGKGKTTIFNLLLGFLDPMKGEVLINNKKVEKDELKYLWKQIAYVRQQSFFIHDTIIKNITLEEITSDVNRLDCALKISGIREMADQFPEGLEKIITENGKNISGGQQQRISIARALYKEASIILLDEPFNELDASSEQPLLDHFSKMAAGGRIVIMITHNPANLKFCNKIIDLDEPT